MKGLIRSLSRGSEIDQKVVKKTIVIDTSVDITGVAGAVDAAQVVIGDLPTGYILLLCAISSIGLDGTGDAHIIDNWEGDYAIGTVPNANLTLAGTDLDLLPAVALDAGASDKIAPAVTSVTTATEQILIDNTGGALEINLNILIDDNVITDTEDGTFAVAGTLKLAYIVL